MRSSLRAEGSPRDEPSSGMKLPVVAGFLAIVALPIPLLAATGLSIPLPSAVARVATGLVPGAVDPKTRPSAALEPPALRITPTLREKATRAAARTWPSDAGTQPSLSRAPRTLLRGGHRPALRVAPAPSPAAKASVHPTLHMTSPQGG